MYALIMAGGAGARFWPKSRLKTPKHLLSIINEKTMLENTVLRLDQIIGRSDCYIITNKEQKENVLANVKDFKEENIIAEPFGRNTAAAIGYGAVKLSLKNPDAIMVVLPADHFIKNVASFNTVINNAVEYCKNDPKALITIGIEPTHPETGYGYIQVGSEIQKGVYRVKSFAEKPNFDTAVRFLESGEFYWNSGMFIWKAETILNNIKIYLPDLYENLMDIRKALINNDSDAVIERIYGEIKSISIDYGVMESAENVKVILGNFGWSDVGSWLEIYRLKKKDDKRNAADRDKFVAIDTEGCLVSCDDKEKLIACIGLRDLIVIDTKDSLLIAPLSRSQDVKELVEKIKSNKLYSVL
ncbi:MAG: NTP transferase domain-containing protein [Candidatus Delongbacteria bacterium]|nr:NTP transferase domain-containing protein [Candidatus Delongbacteria bacterium]MCG2759900.1 NTP transferase domain-containing protein [Candidatus Delongbacteria bacterium]